MANQEEEGSQPDATLIKKTKRVSWLPSSSEEDSSAKSESESEEEEHHEVVLELSMDDWKSLNKEEEEDHTLLPLIQEAVDTMTTEAETSSADNRPPQPTGGGVFGVDWG